MKCPLKIFCEIDSKHCLTYLPDRLIFQHLGLSPFHAWLATFEYGLSASYIHFANIERDSSSIEVAKSAKKIRRFSECLLRRKLRNHLEKANTQITSYEAVNTALDEYVKMVESQGNELFRIIVASKYGNVELAGKVGGLLAKATELDTLIQSRDDNEVQNKYNPLCTTAELEKARDMMINCRQELVSILGETVRNEHLCRKSIITKLGKIPVYSLMRIGLLAVPLLIAHFTSAHSGMSHNYTTAGSDCNGLDDVKKTLDNILNGPCGLWLAAICCLGLLSGDR